MCFPTLVHQWCRPKRDLCSICLMNLVTHSFFGRVALFAFVYTFPTLTLWGILSKRGHSCLSMHHGIMFAMSLEFTLMFGISHILQASPLILGDPCERFSLRRSHPFLLCWSIIYCPYPQEPIWGCILRWVWIIFVWEPLWPSHLRAYVAIYDPLWPFFLRALVVTLYVLPS